MEVCDFDFGRFEAFQQEKEERTNAFLNGKSEKQVLLVELAETDYELSRTPEESLRSQLAGLTQQMDLAGDWYPFLEPWFGVGVHANAFGCEYIWWEGQPPQTDYIVFDESQADALPMPDIDNAPIMQLVLRAIDYFLEETGGRIPISATDTQSPIDTATLIWETTSFFNGLVLCPEVVHGLLDKITRLTIDFVNKQMDLIGDGAARPGHLMLSAPGRGGFAVSDDNMVMLSPNHYLEFSAPYNEAIAKAFDGVAIHSCGNYAHQLDALLQTKGLVQLEGAFSDTVDPDHNEDLELFRDKLKGQGIILKARMFEDWRERLPRLYHRDLPLVLVVPQPKEGEPRDKNVMDLDRILQKIG